MKIFVDGHFLDGSKHGVATYIERLYWHYGVLSEDDEIHFGLERKSPADCDLFSLPNVHFHYYRFGGWLRYIYDIPRLVYLLKTDIVHTQYVIPILFLQKAKCHVTLHDILYEDFPQFFSRGYRWARKLAFKWSARRADFLTTVSNYSRLRIEDLYGRPSDQIQLIPPGIEKLQEQDDCNKSQCKKSFLLYVSRFEKRKNHLNLIKSFGKLIQNGHNINLILVGFDVDGTISDVRKMINYLKLNEFIEIRKNISNFELNNLYRTAEVVVYPSFAEGFGMPIIESYLLNPNTIFSHRTAMIEFPFSEGRTFNPDDIDDITSKISSALSVRSRRGPEEERVIRGDLIEIYNWQSSARALFNLYHDGTLDTHRNA